MERDAYCGNAQTCKCRDRDIDYSSRAADVLCKGHTEAVLHEDIEKISYQTRKYKSLDESDRHGQQSEEPSSFPHMALKALSVALRELNASSVDLHHENADVRGRIGKQDSVGVSVTVRLKEKIDGLYKLILIVEHEKLAVSGAHALGKEALEIFALASDEKHIFL